MAGKIPRCAGDRPSDPRPEGLRRIEQGLRRGPQALGYETGLWTSWRVADSAPVGVELPAFGRPCAGTRCGQGSAVEARALAGD